MSRVDGHGIGRRHIGPSVVYQVIVTSLGVRVFGEDLVLL